MLLTSLTRGARETIHTQTLAAIDVIVTGAAMVTRYIRAIVNI